MAEASQVRADRRQGRGFVLGSLSFGHGISHLLDQGFPFFLPVIAASMGLSYLQVAGLLAIRQVGFGTVNLGGGVFVDMLQRHWGLILTGCMVWTAISFFLIGASPNFGVLVVGVTLVSVPGALWHLPAAAALSQRFPDRRGFALSMHGFGSNIGNALGPLLAGVLLGVLLWKYVLFIYAAPAMIMSVFVWWSLRDVGREGGQEQIRRLGIQFRDYLMLLKDPVVLGLVLAASLRGVGLFALFNWTPFYLKDVDDGLGMGHFRAGFHYALLTGMGIVSAPVLGVLSDKFGRKMVLVPGLIFAAILSMLVVSAGDSFLLALVLAGAGLFSFALHQIIQAALLDVVGRGMEATATGLLFGLNGVFGGASPFLASVIIDHLGGLGSIYYYSGILTAIAAVIVMVIPLQRQETAASGRV